MSIIFDTNELENFSNNFEKAITEIESEFNREKSIIEILTPDFMLKHTKFENLEKMFISLNIPIDLAEFNDFPEEILDKIISKNTSFSSFEDMIATAIEEQLNSVFDNLF